MKKIKDLKFKPLFELDGTYLLVNKKLSKQDDLTPAVRLVYDSHHSARIFKKEGTTLGMYLKFSDGMNLIPKEDTAVVTKFIYAFLTDKQIESINDFLG